MNVVLNNWRKVVLVLAGWVLVAFTFATQAYLNYAYLGRPRPFSQFLSVWLICAAIWALMTPLVLWLAKRFPVNKERLVTSIALHALLGSAVAALQLGLYVFAHRLLLADATKPFAPWQQFRELLLTGFHVNLLLYLVVVALYQAYDYHRRYRERERRAAQLEVEAAQLETELTRAQLDALRMQMHPHFLFNRPRP